MTSYGRVYKRVFVYRFNLALKFSLTLVVEVYYLKTRNAAIFVLLFLIPFSIATFFENERGGAFLQKEGQKAKRAVVVSSSN